MNVEEQYSNLIHGFKVSRKAKLAWLGRKISKKELKLKIELWNKKSEEEKAYSYFCPNCGCKSEYTFHHPEVEYPGVWTEVFCLRCHTRIAWRDNSPWDFQLNHI